MLVFASFLYAFYEVKAAKQKDLVLHFAKINNSMKI